MKNLSRKIAASLLLGYALAACGGGGAGEPVLVTDSRQARLESYAAQSLRVLGGGSGGGSGMPLTDEGAMPASGRAVFDGGATIRVERPGDPLALLGDATVNVNFQTGVTDGALTNFFGATSSATVTDFSGTIALNGTNAGQGANIGYAGRLTATDEDLIFDGVMTASFLANPVAALVASDLEARISDNGTWVDGTLIVIGEGSVLTAP